MTIPRRTASAKASHPNPPESASQVAIHDSHLATQAVLELPALPGGDPAELASTEKTRAALLQLAESPRDTVPLCILWDENRLSIENELQRHLYSDSNSPLLQELLERLVWHARFFCDEVDCPKTWVARCANLEARRLALQLMEAR